MLTRVTDTVLGLYELARLAFVIRFRFRGAYWQWRMHTAFGRGTPGRLGLIRSAIDYGAWAHRLRRSR